MVPTIPHANIFRYPHTLLEEATKFFSNFELLEVSILVCNDPICLHQCLHQINQIIMSASVKILLYTHKPYSDDTNPIMIQVIKDRKIIRKVVGRCKPDQWDEKACRVKVRKHPNAAIINKNIRDEFNRIENEVLGLSEKVTKTEVKTIIENKPDQEPRHLEEPSTEKHKTLVEAIREEALILYDLLQIDPSWHMSSIANEIDAMPGCDTLLLKDVTEDWLNSYFVHLKTREKKPNGANTMKKKLQRLNKVFKRQKGLGLISVNPAENIKIKAKKTLKGKLDDVEFSDFKRYEKLTPAQQMCKDIFMSQFYNRGMRIGDVLQLETRHIQNNRLIYSDDKTEKDFNLKLRPEAIEIFEKYMDDEPSSRIFPLLKWRYDFEATPQVNEELRLKAIKIATSRVNNVLKLIKKGTGIERKVTSHLARHLYAKMAIDKINNPRITMGLVGHTSLKVHQGYIEDLKNLDELDGSDDLIFE